MYQTAGLILGAPMLLKTQAAILLFTCTSVLGAATVPSIATMTTNGEVSVDGSTVQSNATLFNGSVLQTADVSSDVRMTDGSEMVLNPRSRMTLYRDHAVLDQGLAQLKNARKNTVVANGLRVSSENSTGSVFVKIEDPTHIEVSAHNAAADVRTPAGNLVARIEPGKALGFDTAPRIGMSNSSVVLRGTLRPAAKAFVLTDSTTGVTFELKGSNLASYSGQQVQIAGLLSPAAPSIPGASGLVDVSQALPQGAQYQVGGSSYQPSTGGWHLSAPAILFATAVVGTGVYTGLLAAGVIGGSPAPVSVP